MIDTTRIWLAKLLASFIQGASAGVVAALTQMGIDSKDYNVTSMKGAGSLLLVAGVVCLLHGLLDASGFLKASPIPPGWVMIPEQRITKVITIEGGMRKDDTVKPEEKP